VAVILASICVSVMFTLPGTIVLLFLGMVFFHLWLVPNPLIVPIMLISPLSLAGLGAMIGVLSPNQQVSGVIANLTMVIVMYLSPVYAPMSKLPGLLQVTSHLLPPTYAADALRQTLSNQVGAGLIVDLAVLAVFSVGSLYLVTTKLDWRSR
jgi:ABC-2 type transport system permease protein